MTTRALGYNIYQVRKWKSADVVEAVLLSGALDDVKYVPGPHTLILNRCLSQPEVFKVTEVTMDEEHKYDHLSEPVQVEVLGYIPFCPKSARLEINAQARENGMKKALQNLDQLSDWKAKMAEERQKIWKMVTEDRLDFKR